MAVCLLLGLLAAPILGAENEQKKSMQLSGEIISVNAADSSLTVRGKDDASSTFKVNAGTQIVRDGKTIKLEELTSGDKVSVTYEKQAQANVAVMIGVMAAGKA